MTEATVDETPISPTRSLERRDSLEKHLQHRPDVQDLKNRHILLDTNTAPYVQAFVYSLLPQEIEKQNRADTPNIEPCKQRPSSSSVNAPQIILKRASNTVPSARSSSSATSCPTPMPLPPSKVTRGSSRRTCAQTAWRRGFSTDPTLRIL